jgi:hypothetical protein
MIPHEKQIPAHYLPNAPDSQENTYSILFAPKIKTCIFCTSAYHPAGS